MTIQHCTELKKFLITELTITTLFAWVLIVRRRMPMRAFVLTKLSNSQKPFI
jgi:hypothetical protein